MVRYKPVSPDSLPHAMTSSNDSHGYCEANLYPTFDENDEVILSCGKLRCISGGSKSFTTYCANAQCCKQFRSTCPGHIFCCKECFEASGTQAQWEEAKIATDLEHKQRLARDSRKRYLNSEKGKRKKSEQNKRCYSRRKARNLVNNVSVTDTQSVPAITVFPR